MFIEKNILVVLKGDEEEFDKNSVYMFAYTQDSNPVNTVGFFCFKKLYIFLTHFNY
jgi:hypothetical protein